MDSLWAELGIRPLYNQVRFDDLKIVKKNPPRFFIVAFIAGVCIFNIDIQTHWILDPPWKSLL